MSLLAARGLPLWADVVPPKSGLIAGESSDLMLVGLLLALLAIVGGSWWIRRRRARN